MLSFETFDPGFKFSIFISFENILMGFETHSSSNFLMLQNPYLKLFSTLKCTAFKFAQIYWKLDKTRSIIADNTLFTLYYKKNLNKSNFYVKFFSLLRLMNENILIIRLLLRRKKYHNLSLCSLSLSLSLSLFSSLLFSSLFCITTPSITFLISYCHTL